MENIFKSYKVYIQIRFQQAVSSCIMFSKIFSSKQVLIIKCRFKLVYQRYIAQLYKNNSLNLSRALPLFSQRRVSGNPPHFPPSPQRHMIEPCEKRVHGVPFFAKNALSYLFVMVLNTPLGQICLYISEYLTLQYR